MKPSEEDGERKCEGVGGGEGKLAGESAEEEESVAAGCFFLCEVRAVPCRTSLGICLICLFVIGFLD